MSWKRVSIGDIATEDRCIVSPDSKEAAERPYLGLEQIEPNTGEILSYDVSSAEGKSTTFAFDETHVLYGKLRPYLNKVALPDRKGRCSTEIIPLKPDGVDRHLLAVLLRTDKVINAVMSEKTGSRMPRADMDILLSLEVSIPESEDEQARIAAHLDAQLTELGIARHAAETQSADVDLLRTSVYRKAFNQIVPVVLPKCLPNAPDGWQWKKLTDIAELESGHTPSRFRPDWWGGKISWVSLTEIRSLDGKWVEETSIRTNEEGIANSSARILPAGTVCFSRTASVGFVTIMANPMSTSQDFANWICGPSLDPEFLMHALICSRSELRAISEGATHKTIYMPALESFHLCAPELSEQRRIVKNLRETLDKIAGLHVSLEQQRSELKQLPQRIFAQAFES